jgi:YD repeat-containing protein
VRPEGETVRFVYDAFYNIIAVRQLIAGGNYGATSFNLGPLGNPISETTQLGHVTNFETDNMGNITKSADPDGNVSTFVLDARNMLSVANYAGHEPQHFFYDAMGNIVRTEEEMGTTLFTFDAWNRLTYTTDHLDNTVKYFYDNNVNNVRMIYPDGRVVDRTFDHMDRMTSITVDGETKIYRYNPKGELIERVYPSGRITTYTFNHAGYIPEAREQDSAGVLMRQTTFAYRANGLLWSETRTGVDVGFQSEILVFDYDRSGRLTRTRTDGTETGSFTYDIAGNMIREVRDGVAIYYTYNAANQMTQRNKGGVITNFEYDNRGNLIGQVSPAGTRTFEYDSRGRMVFGTNEAGETKYTKISKRFLSCNRYFTEASTIH